MMCVCLSVVTGTVCEFLRLYFISSNVYKSQYHHNNIMHTHTHTHTVPPAPVTNLIVTSVDEREVSLSWMTGFNGFSPITGIAIDVVPEPNSANPPIGVTNTITELSPFTAHTFSVAVQNIVGLSDRVNVTGRTLSLSESSSLNTN